MQKSHTNIRKTRRKKKRINAVSPCVVPHLVVNRGNVVHGNLMSKKEKGGREAVFYKDFKGFSACLLTIMTIPLIYIGIALRAQAF